MEYNWIISYKQPSLRDDLTETKANGIESSGVGQFTYPGIHQ